MQQKLESMFQTKQNEIDDLNDQLKKQVIDMTKEEEKMEEL